MLGIYREGIIMLAERRVRLFRNGRNQAIRIPREFEFDAEEVIVRRENKRLVVEPVSKRGLLALLARLKPIDEDFPDVDSDLGALDDVRL
jgi:antitoxin VapB